MRLRYRQTYRSMVLDAVHGRERDHSPTSRTRSMAARRRPNCTVLRPDVSPVKGSPPSSSLSASSVSARICRSMPGQCVCQAQVPTRTIRKWMGGHVREVDPAETPQAVTHRSSGLLQLFTRLCSRRLCIAGHHPCHQSCFLDCGYRIGCLVMAQQTILPISRSCARNFPPSHYTCHAQLTHHAAHVTLEFAETYVERLNFAQLCVRSASQLHARLYLCGFDHRAYPFAT
jgi:hypothetical protein